MTASVIALAVALCAPIVHASTPGWQPLSAEADALVRWLRASLDNEGAPYIVIDKRRARLWLFDADGRPAGSTPVLLGLARGDASVRGIGERKMADIRPDERTTPAGRFVAEPGRNASGEDIFWIDYEAAVSMHRVRATNPSERRLQRLASPTSADNRISYGCINVPAGFYDDRIQRVFAGRRAVVYLLPETMPMQRLFVPVDAAARAVPPAPAPVLE